MNEEAVKRAKAMRYKKPINKALNWYSICETLGEIAEAAADVVYMDADEIDELLGDEEEGFEFRMAFSSLSAECEQFQGHLEEVRRYDFLSLDSDDEDQATLFDLFFPAVNADGVMLGYDELEEDYFPIDSFLADAAHTEAAKKLKRLTKEQILDAAGMCLRIAQQFLGLQYRYDCLRASLDILRGEQAGLIKIVKGIEEAYAKAEEKTDGFRYDFSQELYEFDRMLTNLPERLWVE